MIEYVNGMSEAEKNFSFLSSAFIFKKVENSSDSLYKKLIELMEKKAKTINDTIKLVTKNESEQIIQEEIKETQKAEAKSKEEKINEDLEELTNEIEELTNEAKETMEDLEDLEDSEKINNETKESEEETMEDLEELSGETEAEETMEDLEELTNETEES
jgi:chromosome segregation ATPase